MLPRCSVVGEGGWGLNVCCMYLNVLFTYVWEVKSLKIHITDDFTDIIKYITGSRTCCLRMSGGLKISGNIHFL